MSRYDRHVPVIVPAVLKLTRRTSALSALAVVAASGVALSAVPAGAAPRAAAHPAAASKSKVLYSSVFSVSVAPKSSAAWALGSDYSNTSSYYALKGSGSHWSKVKLPNPGGDTYYQYLAATSPKSAWAIGGGSGPVFAESKGKAFKIVKVKTTAESLNGIAASSKKNVWVTDTLTTGPGVLHYNGHKWKSLPLPSSVSEIVQVATSSKSNAAFLGSGPDGAIEVHWNGHKFSTTSLTKFTNARYAAIGTSSPKDTWIAGYTYVVKGSTTRYDALAVHSKGKAFKDSKAPSPYGLTIPAGISVAGKSVYLVGAGSPAKGSTKGLDESAFALLYKGGHWHTAHVAKHDVTSAFSAVGASKKLVVAVGSGYDGYQCGGGTKPVYSSAYTAVLHGSSFETTATPSILPDGIGPDARTC